MPLKLEQTRLGQGFIFRIPKAKLAESDGSADGAWKDIDASEIPEHLRSLIRWQYCYSNDEEPKEDDAWQSPSASELDLEKMKITITPPLENLHQHLHVCSFVDDKWGEAQLSVKLKRFFKLIKLERVVEQKGNKYILEAKLTLNIDDLNDSEKDSIEWVVEENHEGKLVNLGDDYKGNLEIRHEVTDKHDFNKDIILTAKIAGSGKMSGEGKSITKSCEIKVAKILGITWVDGKGKQITNIEESTDGRVFISIQTENHHCTDMKIKLQVYEDDLNFDDETKIDGEQVVVEISPGDLEPNGSIKVEFSYKELPFPGFFERSFEGFQWEFYCTTEWGGTNAQKIRWEKHILNILLYKFNSDELELIEMFYGNDFKDYLKSELVPRWTFGGFGGRSFSTPSIMGTPLITASSEPKDKATFIHEIFHQYQYQHGASVNFTLWDLEWNLETPVNFAFWNLIWEQCQYTYDKSIKPIVNLLAEHLWRPMKDTDPYDPYDYSSFFEKLEKKKQKTLPYPDPSIMELREEDITEKIQDIETYEGQAQFMGDVALAILEKKKDNKSNFIEGKKIYLRIKEDYVYIYGHIIVKILANSGFTDASELLMSFFKKED